MHMFLVVVGGGWRTQEEPTQTTQGQHANSTQRGCELEWRTHESITIRPEYFFRSAVQMMVIKQLADPKVTSTCAPPYLIALQTLSPFIVLILSEKHSTNTSAANIGNNSWKIISCLLKTMHQYVCIYAYTYSSSCLTSTCWDRQPKFHMQKTYRSATPVASWKRQKLEQKLN